MFENKFNCILKEFDSAIQDGEDHVYYEDDNEFLDAIAISNKFKTEGFFIWTFKPHLKSFYITLYDKKPNIEEDEIGMRAIWKKL